MHDGGDLFRYYYDHFTVVRANTQVLLDQVYRLRYQVYCIENSFENPADHPSGREEDDHDAASAHLLLLHRVSGMAVGTARVIMPERGNEPRQLPVWGVLAPKLREELVHLPSHQTGEISRFALSKEFRRWFRHHHGSADCSADISSTEQPLSRHLIFGLFEHILYLSIERRINYLMAIMKPSLMRMVGNLGFEFQAIGEPVEYHGIRQPCVAFIPELIRRSQSQATPLWRFVSNRNPTLARSLATNATFPSTVSFVSA